MSLITKIRNDALNLRKSHDPLGKFLMTLVSEVDAKAKNSGRDVTDLDVQEIVKKFIKGIDENISILSSTDPERAYGFIQQRNAIAGYLPQKLSLEEIQAYVRAKRDEGLNMGQIMNGLKTDHFGKYDGKEASQIVKDVLSEEAVFEV